MQIKDIDKALDPQQQWVRPDATLEEAFSQLYRSEGHGAGYTWPVVALHEAIIWLWLKWHQTNDITEIRKTLKPVILRAVQANADPKAYQSLREEHDSFLIQLAILTGSRKLMEVACESVLEADPSSDKYQYLQAWTGILKYRIVDNQEKVEEQYYIMQRWKPDRIYLWPTVKLVETFVERDYKAFNNALRRSCERQWKWAEKEHALTKKVDGTVFLNVEKKHDYFLWPWVEGAFAKLAHIDGAEITYDSPWLPLDLVQAVEMGQTCKM
jgi:hypothetical protein